MSTDEKYAYVLNKPLYRVKFEYFCDKICVVQKYFPRKEKRWRYGPSSKRWNRSKIWTLEKKGSRLMILILPRTLEEISTQNGSPKKTNKKCHVDNFLYYFTFIKATLNIYFILKSIYEDEICCSVFTQNKEIKLITQFHLKSYLTFMVYNIIIIIY